MTQLTVLHTTVYRYQRPVRFGEHRLMFRPRDSHDMRLVDTALTISPAAEVRWLHDVFSNSIAIATFDEPAEELRFESRIRIEHYGLPYPDFAIEPYAKTFPFSYRSEEIPDLVRNIERHYPDPEGKVDHWAKKLVHESDSMDTQEVLFNMTRAINREIAYQRRYTVGVQTPTETLELGSGTCRDMALLMMAGARALGLADLDDETPIDPEGPPPDDPLQVNDWFLLNLVDDVHRQIAGCADAKVSAEWRSASSAAVRVVAAAAVFSPAASISPTLSSISTTPARPWAMVSWISWFIGQMSLR